MIRLIESKRGCIFFLESKTLLSFFFVFKGGLFLHYINQYVLFDRYKVKHLTRMNDEERSPTVKDS